jgi:HD superfamily phosphodiesterase
MDLIDFSSIENRIHAAGENWAIAHARRLLQLIEMIAEDQIYDHQAVQWAAYLHDWGAFRQYYQAGCDHAALSRKITESEILPRVDLSNRTKDLILEAIERHDYRDQHPTESVEALLLREADFLDFLGVIGIAREFARRLNDLGVSYTQIIVRKDLIENRLTLPKAQAIACQRLARMEIFLDALQEESFGFL